MNLNENDLLYKVLRIADIYAQNKLQGQKTKWLVKF